MNALEQLTLEAFQLALSRLEGPLPEAIAQQVQRFSTDLETHIGELRSLAEQFEPLKTQYQAARLELQSQAADRKQFLDSRLQGHGENGTLTSVTHSQEAVPPLQSHSIEPPSAPSVPPAISPEPDPETPTPKSPPLSIPLAKEKILKTLEKSHLSGQELPYIVNQTPEQTAEILRLLWQKGYIETLSTALPYILFPDLRSPDYRNTLPAKDIPLTLTAKGYFHLYPFIKRNNRMASA